jgi:hypothetical protein
MNKFRNISLILFAAAFILCSASASFAQDQQGQQGQGRRGGHRGQGADTQAPPAGAQTPPAGNRRGGNSSAGPGKPAAKMPAKATGPTTNEFFVISSIDKAHHALILLRATQITATLDVDDKTQFAAEDGKALKLTDFRTGDTIFVDYAKNSDGTLTAVHVKKGMMTIAELRKRYLPSLPITPGAKK